MTKHRLIYGPLMIVGIGLYLAADWWLEQSDYLGLLPESANGALFALLVLPGVFVASVELYRMARAKGLHPLTVCGGIVAAALAVSPFVARLHPTLAQLPLWVLGVGTMAVFFCQAAARKTHGAIANMSATLLGVAYLGGLALFIVLIRLDHLTAGLLLYLAAVKATDIGGWAFGSAFGKHKLIPWLSPGKSWEGLFGGMAVAVATSLAICLPIGLMAWWQAVIFGAVIAPAGQLGDLGESLLKRDSAVKDSGSIVPSFGGLLDLFDSPLGAAPVGYLLLQILT